MPRSNEYRLHVVLDSEAIFTNGEKESNLVQSRVLADRDGFAYLHAKTLKGQMKRQAFWILRQLAQINAQRADSFLTTIAQLFGMNEWELEKLIQDYVGELAGMDERHAADWKRMVCMLFGIEQSLIQSLISGPTKPKDAAYQNLLRSIVRKKLSKLPAQGLMKLGNLELPKPVRDHFRAVWAEQIGVDGNGNKERYAHLSRHDLIAAQTHIRAGIQLEQGVVKENMLTSTHTVRKGLIFYAPLVFDEPLKPQLLQDLLRIVHSMENLGAGAHRGRGKMTAQLFKRIESNESVGERGEWVEVLSGH